MSRQGWEFSAVARDAGVICPLVDVNIDNVAPAREATATLLNLFLSHNWQTYLAWKKIATNLLNWNGRSYLPIIH